MKKLAALVLIGLAVGGFFAFKNHWFVKSQAQEPLEEVITGPQYNETTESHVIEDGDTFTSAMEDLGISYSDALAIVDAAAEVFDFTSIKLGKELTMVYRDGEPHRIEYEPGTEYVIKVDLTRGAFETTKELISYDIEIASAELTIDNSLYLDGLDAGLSELLILEFAEVFAWELDFATQVQRGDHMKVLYEKRYRNGQESGIGNVLVGEFTNRGVTSKAYYFEGGYYDAEGNSLIRPFLKAPLSYSRITSGYTTARFHPVTGTTMPHRAIDYAAPIGTPVMAVGDGTVVHAAYTGGYGNFIKIRHNDMFQTHYAHLSAYAVSNGQRVSQGDVIGYVGSTGWSTGPHLHYEVQVNGTLVNPLEVEFPKGDAIAEDHKDAFFAERDRLEGLY